MRVTLIRHPPVSNPRNLCYGRLDLPLQDGWLELISRWPDDGKIHTSPSWRCCVAASRMSSRHEKPRHDARLLEIDFGSWEGIPWENVPRAELDAWASRPKTYHPGGGESVEMMAKRVSLFFHEILNAQEDVVVVTHGGPLRVLRALCCGTEWRISDQPLLPGQFAQFTLD